MTTTISFPNLGIYLKNVGQSISVFGFEIAYYGMIIGLGVIAGILMAVHEAKRTKQDPDTYYDLAMYAVVLSVIGARIYYVIFSWDSYKDDLLSIFNIREGGLAIYGGVITAVLVVYVFSRIKKLSFWQMTDTAVLGLILGQIIGRWGNFFNREAFGEYTDNLLAMRLPLDAVRSSDVTELMREHIEVLDGISYIQVHPTFLYESLWNVAVLTGLLLWRKHKKFQGEIFLLYLLGYGVGRFWIEGLRTDQLLIPGIGLPVSHVLATVLVVVSIITIIILRRKRGKSPA
ncbi:MAG: prolipoprotein diacylglyceryl transferase [Tyzzerella sp.]|nr:prolipoprotein diacylglyceryl transferase [Tyzzerella sp.]